MHTSILFRILQPSGTQTPKFSLRRRRRELILRASSKSKEDQSRPENAAVHNDSERDEDELGSKAELRKFKAGRSLEGSGRALLMTDTALLTYARVGECEGTLDRSCNGKLHPKQVPVDDVQHKMSHWKDIYLQLGRL